MASRQQAWVRDVTYARGIAEPLSFDVQITPLLSEDGDLLGTSIVFVDVTQYRQLQNELEFANRQLGTAYEELQSTDEELETTNEELQSTVEELQVTGEAQGEQQERFYRFNQFMTSVLASLDMGLVVVDEKLTVVTWNRMAEDLWGAVRRGTGTTPAGPGHRSSARGAEASSRAPAVTRRKATARAGEGLRREPTRPVDRARHHCQPPDAPRGRSSAPAVARDARPRAEHLKGLSLRARATPVPRPARATRSCSRHRRRGR